LPVSFLPMITIIGLLRESISHRSLIMFMSNFFNVKFAPPYLTLHLGNYATQRYEL
jgi:hypothetical protein